MIYHVLRLKLADAAFVSEVIERLRNFADIEAVDQVFVGESVRGGDFDVGAIVVVSDDAAFRAYMYDPIHLELDRFVRPHLAAAQVFDLADGEAPDVGDRLVALSTGRETDPELGFSEITPIEIDR